MRAGYRLLCFALVSVLVLLSSAVAYAATCTQFAYKSYPGTGDWFTDIPAAWSAYCADGVSGSANGCARVTNPRHDAAAAQTVYDIVNIYGQCCSQTNVVFSYRTRTGDYCNPCVGGEVKPKLVRVGYARATARADGAPWQTTDGRYFFAPAKSGQAPPGDVPLPDTICDGACTWVRDGAASDFWVSLDPGATGLHPIFRETGYMKTGGQCSQEQKTPETDQSVAPPACDGFLGEINGKTTCVAKEPPTSATGKSGPTGPKSSSTGAGSAPAEAPGKQYGPNGEQPGKPGDASGTQDLGGTGKGVTSSKSTGTGTVTNSTGTTSTMTFDLDIKTCGLPGNPACRIDESGTPTGYGAGKDGLAALGTADESRKGGITGILNKGDKDTSFSMPSWLQYSSACSPWNLGTLPEPINVAITIDFCAIRPYVEGVVSFLWIVGTFIACLGMVGRVMGSGVH